jgi:aminoglycoside phosphotransferase (APT) family kinase protein
MSDLTTIISNALGETIRESAQLGERTWLVMTSDRRRVVVRLPGADDGWSGAPHEAEATALRALAREVEPLLPELLAHEPGAAGYTLLSYCEGQSLDLVIDELSEDNRYAVGRSLGSLLARVHAYAGEEYGPFTSASRLALSRVVKSDTGAEAGGLGDSQMEGQSPFKRAIPNSQSQTSQLPNPPISDTPLDERDLRYTLERLARALDASIAEGSLASSDAERLLSWAQENMVSSGQPPCLVHGDLLPERVLVRKRDKQWLLSGIIGWGSALAWRPAWDHVVFQGAFAEQRYFSVRAGYGNAYDDLTNRAYDQVREFALLPYRLILMLEAGRADLALGLVYRQD